MIQSVFRYAAIAVALTLVGCSGGASGSSVSAVPGVASGPAAGVQSPGLVGQTTQAEPDGRTAIQSSCGTHVRIVLLSSVICHFTEAGYKGQFAVANDTQGIVTVDPSNGTSKTPFYVTGVLVGSGYLNVTDTLGHHLKVHVRVKPAL